MKTATAQQPQPFEYLGKLFTPVETLRGNFVEKSKHIWGNHETLAKLDSVNKNGYSHSDFYKVARKAGAGRIDTFLLNGEKVIPCNKLMYYGQPTWYAEEQKISSQLEKQNEDIQKLLKRISVKSENFAKENKGKHFDDLATTRKELEEIDSFLNNRYLK